MTANTIPGLVVEQGAKNPASPAHFRRINGEWQPTTWADYAARVRQVARAFIHLGLEPGHTVGILGPNSQEWVIFHVGAMAAGCVPAGIYPTSSADEIAYVASHAENRAMLVANADLYAKSSEAREKLPNMHVVSLQDELPLPEGVMSWQEFLSLGDEQYDEELNRRLESLEPGQLATLIYTSGTTGLPKGVMLSHDNLYYTSSEAGKLYDVGPQDRLLSYLPLSHIAEQMFTVHVPASTGSAIYFSRGIDFLGEDLAEVHPTLFFGVPRVWEKFQAAIASNLNEASALRQKMFNWALRVGQRVAERQLDSQPVGLPLRLQHGIARRLVHQKIRGALGMDAARAFMSGAAPLSRETMDFFAGLGMPILDLYGQSEDTGPTTINTPERYRPGTVGRPFPGVDVRLDEDGEILVRGRNVFLGYYKDPEATDATLRDGWLHSGDLGEFDRDGFLKVTGRRKDIIITSGGKNIAPQLIEDSIKANELVAEAVLIGDRRNYVTALITLDEEATKAFMERERLQGDPVTHPRVREVLQTTIDATNEHFARVEQVKKFTILPGAFSIEGGEFTPTLKVKRNVVMEKYADVIEQLYSEEGEPATPSR